ncbi:cell division protein ZapE [Colwelliaceae bacterium 6471]
MKQAYQKRVNDNRLSHDVQQLYALNALSDLATELIRKQKSVKYFSVLHHLLPKQSKKLPVQGIYFYGRVGRGKTMLMDLFFEHLAIKQKKRVHFHRFMEEVHNTLNILSGVDDPLMYIATQWAKEVKVLCFDEFFVSDIGDAMLIGGLLEALFLQGVTLVATSNCPPDGLYRNGLQRQRFVPTIKLIKENCQVISVDGDIDYRLPQDNVCGGYRDYYFPVAEYQLVERFFMYTKNRPQQGTIAINGRILATKGQQGKTIFFDFNALCSGPRSQRDYIFLADNFTTLMLDKVPQFIGERINTATGGIEDGYKRDIVMSELQTLDDEARRFIALVDELYDRRVRLIISAAVDIQELYQGSQLSFEFARCQSRLFEMQSLHYCSD